MEIRESQIEDVLATYPHITQQILGVDTQLSLLTRQMILPSGRLDLLFAAGNRLLLVELKVVDCTEDFVSQILAYRADLQALQAQRLLVQGEIVPVLLCTGFADRLTAVCENRNVVALSYAPQDVLQEFFSQVQRVTPFMTIRPMDSGLWNIHLIHRVLYALLDDRVSDLPQTTGLSRRSVSNHLRFAEQLRLVSIDSGTALLTDLGKRYVLAQDHRLPNECVSEEQAQLLKDLIVKDPFVTPTVFGIYQMIECVFALSRNTYPVPLDVVQPFFRDACGKLHLWQTPKSAYHGTRMYSNYGVELGLLGEVNDALMLTPNGLRFILLLQLHKGIRMVDAL